MFHYAIIGLFMLSAVHADPMTLDKAESFKDFNEVYVGSDDSKVREAALYKMIQLLVQEGSYEQAIEKCKTFLDDEAGFAKSARRGEVRLLMGKSYEGWGMNNDAIKTYLMAWATEAGRVSVSAPAVESYMRILWQRNRAAPVGGAGVRFGDREGAVRAGQRYIEILEPLREKMTESDLKLFESVEKLLKKYQAVLTQQSLTIPLTPHQQQGA